MGSNPTAGTIQGGFMALSIKVKKKTRKSVSNSIELQMMGSEPRFLPGTVVEPSKMADAYNWYNVFYDYAMSRKFLVDYMKEKKFDKNTIHKIASLPTTFHPPTIGWVARILSRGAQINEISKSWFDTNLKQLIKDSSDQIEDVALKPITIQDRIRAQFEHVVTEIDDHVDQFFENTSHTFNIKEYISQKSLNGVVAKKAANHFNRILKEYDDVLVKNADCGKPWLNHGDPCGADGFLQRGVGRRRQPTHDRVEVLQSRRCQCD